MDSPPIDVAIEAIRSFNRFYTSFVGALDSHFLGTEATLGEARLLFEVATSDAAIATDLQASLGIDPGYLSRMLARLEARHWITRDRTEDDARRRPLRLTPEGRAIFAQIDRNQSDRTGAILQKLSPSQQTDLVAALGMVRAQLQPTPPRPITIRTLRAGDMGMIIARQSILYAESNGWGAGLEMNEAETTVAFLKNFKPGREQCWIAEQDGAMAGSVILTDEGDNLSRLRLLYVEPFARRRGLGDRLVTTCLNFARDTGYTAMTLWTHSVLESARRIYAAHGFQITRTETHTHFGTPVQGETWFRPLP